MTFVIRIDSRLATRSDGLKHTHSEAEL
jgi:hypothetical protein